MTCIRHGIRGIRLGDVDWHFFVDADDFIVPNSFQYFHDQAQASHSSDLVTAKALLLVDHGACAGLLCGPFLRIELLHHMSNDN